MSAVTENNYDGNGTRTNYPFTFPYLKTSDIKVSLDGVETSNFTFANATTIQLNNGATPPVATAPANGVKIRILRETTVDNLAATFYAGSAIKSEDLNENFTQNLHVTQEVNQRYLPTTGGTFTGNLNLGNNRITDLGNPVNANDAVNKATLDSTIETDVLAGTDLSKTASGGQVTINHDVTGANSTINNSNGNVIQDLTISAQGHVTSAGSVDLDTRYYTETELDAGALDPLYFRQDSSETIASGQTWSASDSYVATTSAIDARIIDLVDEVGGFDIVNDEQSFPDTNPGGTTGQAAVLSIKAASTNLVPSGTTVTINNGNLANNANITITGVPSTIAQGFGFLVESTSTLHTYTFHRLVPKATEVTTVASNINNVNNVGGNIGDVQTANSNIGDISTVAGSIANVNNVGGSIANVNSVASNLGTVNDFAARYSSGATNPTTNLDTGDLFFNTTANELKIYNGGTWQGGVTATGNLYSDTSVDTHLNQSNPTSGYVLSWNGSDYAWVDNAGYTDSDVNTHLNQSTATSNQVMSWNGSDFAWVEQSSGLVGSSNEKLFVEAENAMDNDFTTTTGNNYVSASPVTLNATLTVVSGSTMTFV